MALSIARRWAIACLVGAAAAGGAGWFALRDNGTARPRLYGNVEIRQVDLAFNSEGAVTTMAKREGDPVKTGEVIAALDPATYASALALADARREVADQQLQKLLNGNRQEDIDQARATAAAAKAALAYAQATYDRNAALVVTNAVSHQTLDDARQGLDSARAQLDLAQAALAEMVNGPRAEDVAVARAQLRQAVAAVALSRTQLERTLLHSPCDGVVMTRVIEPGTVVLPTSAVYSVAITSEVWVRAFVPEPMLDRAAPDATVQVYTDGRPDRPYTGRIGYVSPTAEFTPKTVETPELRTQLVYRVRMRLTDPDSGIRQGQPVTIVLGAGGT